MARKDLYVVGARGFGRDFVNFCRTTPGLLDHYSLVGFLDDNKTALCGYDDYPPIVGSVEEFKPKENDVVFCAMGHVPYRVKYTEMLLQKHCKLDTFISSSAVIHPSAQIGIGCFIWNNSLIGSDAKIGDHVVCLCNVLLGHDVKIGKYSFLDSSVACCGFVTVGQKTAIHTGVKIAPKITVGANAMVGIGSIVIRDVKDGVSVFGNPAQPLLSPKSK